MIIVTEIVRSDVRMLLAIISIIPDLTPNRKKKQKNKTKHREMEEKSEPFLCHKYLSTPNPFKLS
jgi:hypothetical protein